jgi:hypothetical protein
VWYLQIDRPRKCDYGVKYFEQDMHVFKHQKIMYVPHVWNFQIWNKNKKKYDLVYQEQGDLIKRKETTSSLTNGEREEEKEGEAIPVTGCEGP